MSGIIIIFLDSIDKLIQIKVAQKMENEELYYHRCLDLKRCRGPSDFLMYLLFFPI